eukprot:scaffold159188_cov26-Tisochrysis_lutea.AAC.1
MPEPSNRPTRNASMSAPVCGLTSPPGQAAGCAGTSSFRSCVGTSSHPASSTERGCVSMFGSGLPAAWCAW